MVHNYGTQRSILQDISNVCLINSYTDKIRISKYLFKPHFGQNELYMHNLYSAYVIYVYEKVEYHNKFHHHF
jgi:hypothetical protein